MNTVDVLVVGAGMAGASVAWQLARAGLSVIVLEREPQAGVHSTGRSAATFMESYGPPGVRALTRASRRFYVRPPIGFSDTPILHARGALFVATAAQLEALEQMRLALAAGGTDMLVVDAAGLLQRVPVLRPGGLQRGLFDANAYDIDVDALLQGFLRGSRRAGASVLLGQHIVAAEHTQGGWRVTLSAGESLQAHTVVDAAGAWADEVAAMFGATPIGLQPKRRSAFTFSAPRGAEFAGWPMVADIGEGWYFKPDAGQLLGSLANADPTSPHDVMPEDLDIALGIDHIEAVTTMAIQRPTATWAGLRNFVRDGEIVIGFDTAQPNFFWLAAQGGYGIQSAAGASLLAASLIRGANLPTELTDYGVDPAAISPARLRGGTRPPGAIQA